MIRFGNLTFDSKAEYERFIEARQVVAPLDEYRHVHEIVWVGPDFYCLSCGSRFSSEEARTSLTTGGALASCETCGDAFAPENGMFELGEYSYCEKCNKW